MDSQRVRAGLLGNAVFQVSSKVNSRDMAAAGCEMINFATRPLASRPQSRPHVLWWVQVAVDSRFCMHLNIARDQPNA